MFRLIIIGLAIYFGVKYWDQIWFYTTEYWHYPVIFIAVLFVIGIVAEAINQAKMQIEPKRLPDNKKYHPKTKEELIGLCKNEEIYLGDIDTSAITDMSELFVGYYRSDFSGIESWDVSNVKDMSYMFNKCSEFNQPLNSWDVSNVENMEYIFAGCESLEQVPGWYR